MRSVIAALSLFAAGPAAAGDAAELGILGFSADGGVFAFEEYGIQDGSGFPYSSIFIIDTAKDAFIPGTPIRVRIDDVEHYLSGLIAYRAYLNEKEAFKSLVSRQGGAGS